MKILWIPTCSKVLEELSVSEAELDTAEGQGPDTQAIFASRTLLFKHKNAGGRAPEEKKEMQKITCGAWLG